MLTVKGGQMKEEASGKLAEPNFASSLPQSDVSLRLVHPRVSSSDSFVWLSQVGIDDTTKQLAGVRRRSTPI